jgi:hypothetical protein
MEVFRGLATWLRQAWPSSTVLPRGRRDGVFFFTRRLGLPILYCVYVGLVGGGGSW